MTEQTTSLAQSVLSWLRAGYPEGIPKQDYVPLLGVLHRRLTSDEIKTISTELADQSVLSEAPITREDIEALVSQTVYQRATDVDVSRVSARLAAGGWPLADPHTSE